MRSQNRVLALGRVCEGKQSLLRSAVESSDWLMSKRGVGEKRVGDRS